MPRAASPSSDQEEGNDSILQEELKKLKDTYRILQNDRNKSIEDSQTKLKKYNDEIKHLEANNRDLRSELNLAESDQNKKLDDDVLDELEDLTIKYDRYVDEIETEKRKIEELKKEIKHLEKQEYQDKRKATQQRKGEDFQATTQKKIHVMENRLSKGNKACNNAFTEIAKLRDQIAKLGNERAIFNKVYGNLDEQLTQLRQEKADLTEKATQAYDQRDDANNKCQALKDKNDKDKLLHEMERRDLQRIIDHDNRLRDFMRYKWDERAEWKKMEEERRKKHGSAGEMARDQQRQKIDTYEDAITRIKEITKKEDLDLIVSEFIRQEDENFAFFKYVSELNNQVESLHEEMDALEEEKKKYEAEEVTMEEERQKILSNLEIKIEERKAEADKADARLTEVKKILDQLKTGVKSVFTKIGCNDDVIVDMLGGDSDVSDRNVMLYLGAVEQKTKEYIFVQYYIQTRDFQTDERKEQPDHGITLGVTDMPKIGREISIVPPGIGDDFDESSEASGDELRPMSQAELMHKVYKGIKKHDMAQGSRSQTKILEGIKKNRK